MSSTPADWKRIEELAEKVTPGPFKVDFRDRLYICRSEPTDGKDEHAIALFYRRPGETADDRRANADYFAATANAAPDMAARLRRLSEILLPVIDSELSHPSTDEFNLADLSVKAHEARELRRLLTGEEGGGK